jgi:hypothetical protein
VNSLGLAEPNLQTAKYGNESHIIVQIPTQDYGTLSEVEKKKKTAADLARAKETIGKVVQLEFRERNTAVTESDKAGRKALADKALTELQVTPFATVGAKYRDQYENVGYTTASGALPEYLQLGDLSSVKIPYTTPVTYIPGQITTTASGDVTGPGGYAIVALDNKFEILSNDASGATVKSP